MKIASRDAARLIAVITVSKILFSDIGIFVENSGTAAYIEAVIGGFAALILFLIILFFYKKLGCPNFFETFEFLFGKTFKNIILTSAFVFLIFYTSVNLKIYTDAVITIAYPNSNVFYIMMFIVATIIVTAYNGIDTVARFCSVCLVPMICLLGILFLLSLKNADVSNLFPIFGNGVNRILSGVKSIFIYSEVVFLFPIAEFLDKRENSCKIGLRAFITAATVIIISTFVYTLCVPYPSSRLFNLPLLQLASATDIDVFFQRTEGLFFVLWIYSSFLYTGTTFYFSLHTLKKAWNLTDFKGVIPSCSLIAVLITLFFDKSDKLHELYMLCSEVFSIFAFGIPLLTFGGAYVKRRVKKC